MTTGAACTTQEAQEAPTLSMELTATVRDVKPRLLESVPHVGITIEFSNRTAHALVVDSFRLVWKDGEHVERNAGALVPAAGSALHTVQIVTADPPDPSTTRAEVLQARPPSLWEKMKW
jgi:hypothetical protein